MRFLELPPPDFNALPGGSGESGAWLAARARKLAFAAEDAPGVYATLRAVSERGGLFRCTPEILREVPAAAQFYLDMLALTDKTLNALRDRAVATGLSVRPATVAASLASGRVVRGPDLHAFAAFVNAEMDHAFAEEWRTEEVAAGIVFNVRGARIQGRVQNQGGDDAVVLLKQLLLAAMENRGLKAYVSAEPGGWVPYSASQNLLTQKRLRFGGRLTCEFVPGGNRADIVVSLNGMVIAVGEVKGRKDLSNLWESWMPQIMSHLRNWTFAHPDAKRLFFGTVITEEMITGMTTGGTQHAGLRVMYENGLLSAAYNLSLIAAGDPRAVAAFDLLIDRLCEMAASLTTG